MCVGFSASEQTTDLPATLMQKWVPPEVKGMD
jgi:hypothetical protein